MASRTPKWVSYDMFNYSSVSPPSPEMPSAAAQKRTLSQHVSLEDFIVAQQKLVYIFAVVKRRKRLCKKSIHQFGLWVKLVYTFALL